MNKTASSNWDTSYEWKIVAILGLGLFLAQLDRWFFAYLLPVLTEDIGLVAGGTRQLIGITGLVWGVTAIMAGRLSDKIGHGKILLPTMFLLAILLGFSATIQNLATLTVILVLLGVMKGSFYVTSFTAVAVASSPLRRGCNLGLFQCCSALLGLAAVTFFVPMIPELLISMSWRSLFLIVAIPGFIVGALLFVFLRKPQEIQAGEQFGATQKPGGWIAVLRSRNTIVCMFAMACVFAPLTLLPTHLITAMQHSPKQMGVILSAVVVGGFFGPLGWPALSDVLGRKPPALLGFVGAATAAWWFISSGGPTAELWLALFACSYFCSGNLALIYGPIAVESAPGGLISSTIGIVVGAGVLIGAAVVPAVAQVLASAGGFVSVGWTAVMGSFLGALLCLFLKETAPVKIMKKLGTDGSVSDVPLAKSGKSKVVAYLLLVFLGGFGAYRFYLGRVASGVVLLHLTLLALFFLVLSLVTAFIPGGDQLFEFVCYLLSLMVVVWLVVDGLQIPKLVMEAG